MVRMTALKTFRPAGAKDGVSPGEEYDVKENLAAQHEKTGLAARVGKHKAAAQPKAAGPLSRAGGQTGKAARSSSSRPARAPRTGKPSSRKRTSARGAAAGKS